VLTVRTAGVGVTGSGVGVGGFGVAVGLGVAEGLRVGEGETDIGVSDGEIWAGVGDKVRVSEAGFLGSEVQIKTPAVINSTKPAPIYKGV